MSKVERKYDSLPKLQKKILICLAKKGALLIMDTNENIKGEYSSTNRAFHELEAKKLIKEVEKREYRKRKWPMYWLDSKGIMSAFFEETNPNVLLEYAKKYYPDDQEIHVFLHIAGKELVPKRVLINALLMSDEEGKFNPENVMISYLDYVKSGIHVNKKQVKELADIFKQYPKYNPLFKSIWSAIYQRAKEIDEVLSHE